MEQIVAALRAIGEVTRLRIVALLVRGELTVSELVQVLGQSQPRVSRHLKLLAEAGLVERLPEGAWVFYRLTAEPGMFGDIVRATVAAMPDHDPARVRDMERLADVRAARARAARAYFSDVAADWDRVRALHTDDRLVEHQMLESLNGHPIETLVDIGTGTGRMLELFAPVVRRAIGIDLSHEMLTVARANLDRAGVVNASVRHGDLYALPLMPGSADGVVLHQVLHYLDDPGRALHEAARLLRPGGIMLVADFAPHDHEFLRENHAHRRLGFDDDELEQWLGSAGLDMCSMTALAPAEKAFDEASSGVSSETGNTIVTPSATPFATPIATGTVYGEADVSGPAGQREPHLGQERVPSLEQNRDQSLEPTRDRGLTVKIWTARRSATHTIIKGDAA